MKYSLGIKVNFSALLHYKSWIIQIQISYFSGGGSALELWQFFDYILPLLAISVKTSKNYASAFEVNIKKNLGHRKLNSIKKGELVDLLAPLPAQTKYQTLMVLRVIFREAEARELVKKNVAKEIKSPKIQVKPRKFLTWEELSTINFGYQTKRIHFLALHGLRYGEAAALTKRDIRDGYVHITKSKWGATKSEAGNRKVPLVSEFVPFPKYQTTIARALKPHGVTVHSLRRTYAYTLESAGIHVTTAAKLMGHSNPMMTLKVYTQVKDDETGAAGVAIASYIRKEPGISPGLRSVTLFKS